MLMFTSLFLIRNGEPTLFSSLVKEEKGRFESYSPAYTKYPDIFLDLGLLSFILITMKGKSKWSTNYLLIMESQQHFQLKNIISQWIIIQLEWKHALSQNELFPLEILNWSANGVRYTAAIAPAASQSFNRCPDKQATASNLHTIRHKACKSQ